MVLLKDGKVAATGPVQEVFSRLDLPGLVESNMVGAILETRIVEHEPQFGLTRVEFLGQCLFLPQQALPPGAPLKVQILSRDVSLVVGDPPSTSSVLNTLEGDDCRGQEITWRSACSRSETRRGVSVVGHDYEKIFSPTPAATRPESSCILQGRRFKLKNRCFIPLSGAWRRCVLAQPSTIYFDMSRISLRDALPCIPLSH